MTGKYDVHGEYEESKLHAPLERILDALATMDVRKQIFQRITDNDYNYYMYKTHYSRIFTKKSFKYNVTYVSAYSFLIVNYSQ